MFESEGLTTVLVGFVREQIETLKPARALFLDFPMGRGMGKPNDPKFQKQVIRSAFKLLDVPAGPVLEDFPEIIPVQNGRMGYALPPELVLKPDELGDLDSLINSVELEMGSLKLDYAEAVKSRGRTTVGASNLSINEFVPFISKFLNGFIPKSPQRGVPAIPLLKLVVEDLEAFYTETRTYRDGVDDFELIGKWFWEETKAGRLLLSLESVALESDNSLMRQIVEMSLMTPRFWSEGPLPGTSASGW